VNIIFVLLNWQLEDTYIDLHIFNYIIRIYVFANMIDNDAGHRRSDWKGVTTTLCVDISESMATSETWSQVREFVGSFLQGENRKSLTLLAMHIYRS